MKDEEWVEYMRRRIYWKDGSLKKSAKNEYEDYPRNKTKEMPEVNFASLGIQGGVDLVREMVRIRDKRTCQICKKVWVKGQRRFDVHHLDEELESSDNKPELIKGRVKRDRENMDRMITYCHKCHLNLHAVRQKITKGIKEYQARLRHI